MNTFGRKFKVSIFGESHGEAIGVVLDGVPAGIGLSQNDLMVDILRRKSGAKGTTPRIEADEPHIVSGVFQGHTTGAPLTIIFKNTNTRSEDYSKFFNQPRPGHADLVAAQKWAGNNDPRGGGHFSGRLTLPIVAAGAVAKAVLAEGHKIKAGLVKLGGIDDATKWDAAIESAMRSGDSLGGVVECTFEQPSVGLGEPFFDSVESVLAHALFAIPGVRGVEFGDGFASAAARGSEHNDVIVDADGTTATNHSGGVNGGITNGNPLVFRVAFKPTATISKNQNTMNMVSGQVEEFSAKGRHDACFALRTPVVVEAMTAIVLADFELIR